MCKAIISASLLAAPVLELRRAIDQVVEAGVNWLHLDIMDNHYVDNLWGSPDLCLALRKHYPNLTLDVHLMTERVDMLIERFADAGADYLTIHSDATPHLDRALRQISARKCKAGVAINPASSCEFLPYVADQLSLILLMSVNPGLGGQNFLPSAQRKLQQVAAWRDKYAPQIKISVDGGVNMQNSARLRAAGADVLVVGSAIFSAIGLNSHTVMPAADFSVGSTAGFTASRALGVSRTLGAINTGSITNFDDANDANDAKQEEWNDEEDDDGR